MKSTGHFCELVDRLLRMRKGISISSCCVALLREGIIIDRTVFHPYINLHRHRIIEAQKFLIAQHYPLCQRPAPTLISHRTSAQPSALQCTVVLQCTVACSALWCTVQNTGELH